MSTRKFIQLTDEEHEELKSKLDRIQAKKDLVDELADRIRDEKVSLWALIHELYPEVVDKSATLHSHVGKISYDPAGLDDAARAAQNLEQLRLFRKLHYSDLDSELVVKVMEVLSEDDE